MSESVSLPALGESVTEGTVTRWLKNVGDRVEVDEPLLEVSTDKVDTEIPSPIAGVIEAILVQEDETVEVGTPLVTISDGADVGTAAPAEPEAPAEAAESEAAAAPEPETEPVAEAPVEAEAVQAPSVPETAKEAEAVDDVPVDTAPTAPVPLPVIPPAPGVPFTPSSPVAAPAPVVSESPAVVTPAPVVETPTQAPVSAAPVASSGGAHAGAYVTPIVRKIATEQGVDLSSVTGTGVGGRIRKDDILSAAAAAEVVSSPAAPTVAAPAAALVVSPLRGTTVALSRLRKVIADRAVASMQSTAQLTTVVEADVTRIAILRDRVKTDFLSQTGAKLSFLPFFALAAVEALKTYPIINSTVEGDSIVYPDHENLSIAVDTERGLLTPVVQNAGDKNIAELAMEIADLAERTRDNRLKPDELAGGTFTLTNTGSRGALFDTPLVFLPQVAILGTGAVVKKPAVVKVDGQDAIAVRSIAALALSYDHRIVDGADAARYLSLVKQRLETGAFEADLGISL